jgi:hypothetical protein
MKTPEYAEKDPGDLKPADKGDIETKYLSNYLYISSTGTGTKNYL